MKRYNPRTPRTFFGIASVAMTTITLGLLVLLPAHLESNGQGSYEITTSHHVAPSNAA